MRERSIAQSDISINVELFGWVYIITNSITQELMVGVTLNPEKRITRVTENEKLVYYRGFTNPFDAMAHKHMLEELSMETIMHNVTQQNPTLKNLISEIGGKVKEFVSPLGEIKGEDTKL